MIKLFQEFTKFLQLKGHIKEESRGYVGEDTPRINAISEEFLEPKDKWIKIKDVIEMVEKSTNTLIMELKWKLLENSGLDKPLDVWDPFDNEQMLEVIRKDRPEQVIHEVLSVEKNEYGFYTVEVIMESLFFNTIVKNTKVKLPYPVSKYLLLSDSEANKWMRY